MCVSRRCVKKYKNIPEKLNQEPRMSKPKTNKKILITRAYANCPNSYYPHPNTEILDFQSTTRIPHLYQLFRGTFTFLVHLSLSKCSTICICGDHFCRKPSWGSSRNSKHKFLRSRVTIYKDQHLLANWARATTMLAVQKRASSYQLWNLDHVCASFGFPSNA